MISMTAKKIRVKHAKSESTNESKEPALQKDDKTPETEEAEPDSEKVIIHRGEKLKMSNITKEAVWTARKNGCRSY